MKRLIKKTEDGSATLYVPELDEHYHSVKGAHTESQHIFIEMGLRACTAVHPHVLEIGFGTGLNALLSLEEAERMKRPVHYTGIELYPLTWSEVSALHYSNNPLFQILHEAPWEKKVCLTPYFTLEKIQSDITFIAMPESGISVLSSIIKEKFDVIYYDAFAPEKQAEMWQKEIFHTLYASLKPGGILTTYCAKGNVRRMLQEVGFLIERLPGPPGGKREILRGRKKIK